MNGLIIIAVTIILIFLGKIIFRGNDFNSMFAKAFLPDKSNSKHPKPKLKNSTINWSRNILINQEKFLILDCETTGLGNNDVIIQIAIIAPNGDVKINSLIKPTRRRRISSEVSAIHGISMNDLVDQPTFKELMPIIKKIIRGKKVVIYNKDYDIRIIDQTCDQDGCPYLSIRSECAMIKYSAFVGQWSEYHRNFKYQKLPGGDHTALGDCKATLEIIKEMANTNYC